MAIDDDLAAIGEFQFKNPASSQFEVDGGIARIQCHLDPGQDRIGQGIEFLIIHRVLTSLLLLTVPSLMSRIVAVLLTLCLAGCGLKGPLVLPPGPAPAPVLDSLKWPSPPSDVSTDQKTATP